MKIFNKLILILNDPWFAEVNYIDSNVDLNEYIVLINNQKETQKTSVLRKFLSQKCAEKIRNIIKSQGFFKINYLFDKKNIKIIVHMFEINMKEICFSCYLKKKWRDLGELYIKNLENKMRSIFSLK